MSYSAIATIDEKLDFLLMNSQQSGTNFNLIICIKSKLTTSNIFKVQSLPDTVHNLVSLLDSAHPVIFPE